ncbi:hypothetical protein C8R46DRAFT_1066569 [Mycena filopes]|nr:hypothetical protein C8R46DRAFT_1066569 [Mycena filopes]
MPSSDESKTNASGFTPDETRSLTERSPEAHEQRIMQSLKELYTCKPQSSTYDIYTKDATFHDPIGYARGLGTIRAQFDALPKLFPRADIPKFHLLQNPASAPKDMILIDQDVAYFRDPKGSPTKTVNSLLTLRTNDSHQVTSHTEEWNHQRETHSEDGFFGMLNEQRKKLTANITSAFMGKSGDGE